MGIKAIRDESHVAVPMCYYCNESKNELILHKQFKNISVLHNHVIDMEPCTKCAERMQQGVILVSVKDGESMEGNPPNPYRTGGWWVVTIEAAKRIFRNIDFDEQRFCFIEDSIAKQVGLKKGGQDGISNT